MKIPSPFSENASGSIIKEIDSNEIISAYKDTYQIDVSNLLKDIPKIFLCKCSLSKMLYYFPFDLDGDANFYKSLSEKDWYYHNERWEHQAALKFVKANDNLLEIGSGAGSFIKQLTQKYKVNYCGLELNPAAIEKAAKDSIILTNELLNVHCVNNSQKYDVVCSFQVYEHISRINQVFIDSFKVLKKGGLLIVSVPNNDVEFIIHNKSISKYLNMPPHHTNLFTEESLNNIAKIYDVKLKAIVKEPIQDLHVDVYLHNKMSNVFMGSSFLLRAFWKLKLHVPLRGLVKLFRNKITGHTIIGVFEKNN
jgi:2-polyprenyl-3-methyl-5-hydroxy-6-metoxy-1,4-benzoquinol methylase